MVEGKINELKRREKNYNEQVNNFKSKDEL